MIKVNVLLNQDKIQELEVSGHANYAKSGQDLVCAGVSSIMYGTYNALVELCTTGFNYEVANGYFKISILEESDTIQIVIKTALVQLETVETSYANYIKIKKMEV